MNFFGRSKNKNEVVLLLDVGSSSVGVALVELNSKGAPKILHFIRQAIRIEEVLNTDRFHTFAMHTLHKVVAEMCNSAKVAPKRAFCILASPWYSSQTRTIKYEQNTPFVFTQKFVDGLIEKEIKLFEEEHNIGKEDSLVRAIELKTMKTVLNGYTVQNPINQKAKNAKITVFFSMGEERILKEIEESIWRHFPELPVKFSSFLVSSFIVARDMFVNHESFLLVNIGGEVTDIAITKDEILKESATFPLGSHFITRGISKSLSCSMDDARSCIMLYDNCHMSEQNQMKFQEALKNLKTTWLAKFQSTLASLSSDISIPATVFITVDPSLARFFADTIKSEQFNQYTLTEAKFRVVILGMDALHGIANIEQGVNKDSSIIIESIYINNFLK